MVSLNKNYFGNCDKNELEIMVTSDNHDVLKKDKNNNFYFSKHKTIADTAEKNNIKLIVNTGDPIDEDDIVDYLTEGAEELMEDYVDSVLSEEDKELSYIGMLVAQRGIESLKKKAEESKELDEQIQLQYIIDIYEKADKKKIKDALQKNMAVMDEASEVYKHEIEKTEKDLDQYYDFLTKKLVEAYADYSGKILYVGGNHGPDKLNKLCEYDDKFIRLDNRKEPVKIGDFKFAGTPNFTEGDDDGIFFPKIGNLYLKKLYEDIELDTMNKEVIQKFVVENQEELKSKVDEQLEQNKEFLEQIKQNSEEQYNEMVNELEQQVFQQMIQQKIPEKSNVYNRLKDQDFNILCTHNPADNKNTVIYEIDEKTKEFVKNEDGSLKIKEKEVGQSSLGVTKILQEKIPDINLCGHIHSGQISEDFLRPSPKKFTITKLKSEETDEGKKVFIDNYRTFSFKKVS